MTWLEDPPPWLRPAYCFASVRVGHGSNFDTASHHFDITSPRHTKLSFLSRLTNPLKRRLGFLLVSGRTKTFKKLINQCSSTKNKANVQD